MNFFKIHWKRVLIITAFVILTALSLEIGSMSDVGLSSMLTGGSRAADIDRQLYAVELEIETTFELERWLELEAERIELEGKLEQIEIDRLVFLYSRVPRTLAVILAAASLSVAGLIMQAISRNKFMSPTTAGTTDAAAFGLLLSYIFLGNQSGLVQASFAFVFALLATMLFTSVINRMKIREVVYIPLVGMMYGGVISAVSSAVAFRFDAMQVMTAFGLATFARLGVFTMVYIVIIPLVFSVLFATKFSIIGLGADFAKNLGLNYNRVVFIGLVIISLISASTFVAVGPLPFIGLIIPNMATSFYGDNLKKSIFDLMLFGAAFVLLCDIISRLIIYPWEMNISITISVVGGAIFMFYLIRGMYGGRSRKKAVAN